MPQKPRNPDEPGQPDDEGRGVPPKPEQIWPPPERSAPAPQDEGAIELDWNDEVEKIDEAIEEIRKINGGPETHHAEEHIPEAVAAPPPRRRSAGIVAGVAEAEPEPSYGGAVAGSSRVRPQAEDEVGQLWGNVFFSLEHPAPKLVMVTSARRGDGSTQIATSLALVGAAASDELKVALVDFNLRDPGVADLLGLKGSSGLTDILDGRATLESAMQAVGTKNGNKLYVLPAGSEADHPLGLLKSRQVKALLGQLRDRFDHVVIDVACASLQPDAQLIGSQVDGALLVLRAGETSRETVGEAKKRLDLAGVRCLGLVLNQRTDPIPGLLYRMT